MPRGQQKSIDEKIAEIEQNITVFESKSSDIKTKLSELTKQKRELLKQKSDEELIALKNFIEETGMSVEEATQKFRDKVFTNKK